MEKQLFVLFVFSISVNYFASAEKYFVCYYGTWATYRQGLGKFDVDHVNPDLCTHLVYSFVGIDNNGNVISLDSYLDFDKDNFRKFNALKTKNPNLKTILAVGGWNEGSYKYSVMAANSALRKNFIQSALKMVLEYGFDGFDIDWEYPNRRDTAYGVADIDNFTQLLKEMREEFDKYGLLLTAAVSSVKQSASLSYDIPAISKYLDIISLMTYDLYGAWDPVTGHNAGLYRGEGDENVSDESLFTVDLAVKYWLSEGCPPEKLVLGLPFYGRTFTLANPNVNNVRAPSVGSGIGGPYTITSGFMGYNELCQQFQTESWDIRYDSLAKVPYAVNNANWVSYDDPDSLTTKVEYAMSLNLGGAMVWSIETDDFHGTCGEKFSLLKAIKQALGEKMDSIKSTSPSIPTTVTSDDLAVSSESESSESESSESESSESESSESESSKSESSESESAEDLTAKSTTLLSSSDSPSNPSPTTTSRPDGTVVSGPICNEEGYAPDPNICSVFYICVADIDGTFSPRKFDCPGGTFWDQNKLQCEHQSLVKCT